MKLMKISAWLAVHLWGIRASKHMFDDDDEFRKAVDHFRKKKGD